MHNYWKIFVETLFSLTNAVLGRYFLKIENRGVHDKISFLTLPSVPAPGPYIRKGKIFQKKDFPGVPKTVRSLAGDRGGDSSKGKSHKLFDLRKFVMHPKRTKLIFVTFFHQGFCTFAGLKNYNLKL